MRRGDLRGLQMAQDLLRVSVSGGEVERSAKVAGRRAANRSRECPGHRPHCVSYDLVPYVPKYLERESMILQLLLGTRQHPTLRLDIRSRAGMSISILRNSLSVHAGDMARHNLDRSPSAPKSAPVRRTDTIAESGLPCALWSEALIQMTRIGKSQGLCRTSQTSSDLVEAPLTLSKPHLTPPT